MEIVRGNILEADGLIAIPVNVVGVCGKGLAKQWKDENPEHYHLYTQACATNEIRHHTTLINWFWMLPTKVHWRDKSDWESIEDRLRLDLHNIGVDETFEHINLPKIGCGLGGLDWDAVLPKLVPILLDFEETTEISVSVYV